MKSIEEQKKTARNTNELLDYLMKLIEENDERFSFEWLVGGKRATMEIFDKEKKIGYVVKVEPIEYDENGNAVNLLMKQLFEGRNQMIYGIKRDCKHEHIIYSRIDNENVRKCYYNENGKKTKEEEINVRDIRQNRRSYRNTQDFFEDMIWNYGYYEVK